MGPDTPGLIENSSSPSGGGNGSSFLLTVVDPAGAAAYLRVPEQVIVNEAERGALPGQKLGGEWRFLVYALVEWLRGGRTQHFGTTDETPAEQDAFLDALRKIRDSWGTVGGDDGEISP